MRTLLCAALMLRSQLNARSAEHASMQHSGSSHWCTNAACSWHVLNRYEVVANTQCARLIVSLPETADKPSSGLTGHTSCNKNAKSCSCQTVIPCSPTASLYCPSKCSTTAVLTIPPTDGCTADEPAEGNNHEGQVAYNTCYSSCMAALCSATILVTKMPTTYAACTTAEAADARQIRK